MLTKYSIDTLFKDDVINYLLLFDLLLFYCFFLIFTIDQERKDYFRI